MLKLKNNYKNNGAGFTLVELLVVITILGILATIGLTVFASAQVRSRDSQRKSDLKQLSNALEVFYSDYAKYPDSSSGQIEACGYNSATKVGAVCVWGSGEFRDTDGSGTIKTVYFTTLPKDPSSGSNYYYRIVDSGTNQKFQLFAHLENTQDPGLITTSYSCGNSNCNFAITSANTTPAE